MMFVEGELYRVVKPLALSATHDGNDDTILDIDELILCLQAETTTNNMIVAYFLHGSRSYQCHIAKAKQSWFLEPCDVNT